MEFWHCENIWRAIIGSFGVNGLSKKKGGIERKRNPTKKCLAQIFHYFCFSLII
jgi:hypothetical protein